jgi:hypothetical protein
MALLLKHHFKIIKISVYRPDHSRAAKTYKVKFTRWDKQAVIKKAHDKGIVLEMTHALLVHASLLRCVDMYSVLCMSY